ncbi:MAG: hypothetical protein ACLSB7_04880 [Parabacteroides distasonis]
MSIQCKCYDEKAVISKAVVDSFIPPLIVRL